VFDSLLCNGNFIEAEMVKAFLFESIEAGSDLENSATWLNPRLIAVGY